MDELKFDNLMKDESFAKKLFEVKTSEEIKSIFSKNGLELSDNDFSKISQTLNILNQSPNFVSETELLEISGGLDNKSLAVGAGAASAVSALIISGIYGAYKLYKKGIKDGQEELMKLLNLKNPNQSNQKNPHFYGKLISNPNKK